ncbi:pseudaminic acid synthase [Leptospira noguchii str. 1993005606]|uniref:Pseudaminic acid synthase n=2 Tax=Leptospira noguchii TaxID=28182 RepID=M6YA01_9LEPT|nr:pseudaminic acid synthase [Leptospira noguchii]EMN01256.1 pseudaminic acid synthase [Leptospira noguchii str. 2007001578]EMO90565.1 pseudaminic acid synthase [Leptospira noguchii str. 2001034031]EPE83596.1 pseudaminic acid synthase [Leptospira noguchii str. 1993005606]
MKHFKIEDRIIGEGNPVFIIAELSANHGGKIETAIESIHKIKSTGADAVKVQTFKPEGTTIDCDNDYFRIKSGTQWDNRNLFELYSEAYMPWEWQPKLKKVAKDLGLIFFSSVTSQESTDFMESIGCPVYKIASFEITDIPLIKYVASKGKPVILSKGIATLSDLDDAVKACREVGNNQIAVLQCTSAYPSPIEESNLKTISNIEETFSVISGLSDHTLGIISPIVAVSLGAKIIEKHFISDKSIGGPDSSFSLNTEEFSEMVRTIRVAEKTIGKVSYELSEKTIKSRDFARSLFVITDIKKGDEFSNTNVKAIRPGYGLHPKFLQEVIGKKASRDIERGTPVQWNLLV